jgi:hypothetical protein
VWGQENTTNFFHGFLQLVHNHWGFIARAIIHWTLETPSCGLWIQGVTPQLTTHLALGDSDIYLAFLAPPFGTYRTDLYHLLGQVMPILGSWWHMFILGDLSKNRSLNMIYVTYQTRGLPVTPKNSFKLSVAWDTVSKSVTQILPPCC